MNKKFAELMASLEPKRKALLEIKAVTRETLPKGIPSAGVYLFSEKGTHLYVGRSNTIRKRLCRHCRPSAKHNMASFAFLLAKKECGIGKATYRKDTSRAKQLDNPKFRKAIRYAKERIRNMDVRFVEEPEPIKQALLEIYVATVLGTPFNDFSTH